MPVSDETRRAERDVTGEGKCERFNTFLLLELFVSFRFLHFLHQRQTKATHSHKHSSYTHTHTPIHTWGKRRQNRQTTRKKCRLAQLIKTRNSFSFFLCCCCFSFFFVFFVFFVPLHYWQLFGWSTRDFPNCDCALRFPRRVIDVVVCILTFFTRFLTLFLFLFLSFSGKLYNTFGEQGNSLTNSLIFFVISICISYFSYYFVLFWVVTAFILGVVVVVVGILHTKFVDSYQQNAHTRPPCSVLFLLLSVRCYAAVMHQKNSNQ